MRKGSPIRRHDEKIGEHEWHVKLSEHRHEARVIALNNILRYTVCLHVTKSEGAQWSAGVGATLRMCSLPLSVENGKFIVTSKL